MTTKFDFPIDELKYYLTRQLEAFHQKDQEVYKELELKISEIEKRL